MEIKLTLEATGLCLSSFAEILAGLQGNPDVVITQSSPAFPPTAQEPAPAAPVMPQAPAAPPQAPASTVPAEGSPPAAAIPTAAPAYTLEQLSTAGALLLDVDSANMGRLQTVLREQFGVPTLLELPQERYAEYAGVLRSMGAKL